MGSMTNTVGNIFCTYKCRSCCINMIIIINCQHKRCHHYRRHDDKVKDVRVPEQLQRAMAAEAEAAREARAKVIVVDVAMMMIIIYN